MVERIKHNAVRSNTTAHVDDNMMKMLQVCEWIEEDAAYHAATVTDWVPSI